MTFLSLSFLMVWFSCKRKTCNFQNCLPYTPSWTFIHFSAIFKDPPFCTTASLYIELRNVIMTRNLQLCFVCVFFFSKLSCNLVFSGVAVCCCCWFDIAFCYCCYSNIMVLYGEKDKEYSHKIDGKSYGNTLCLSQSCGNTLCLSPHTIP